MAIGYIFAHKLGELVASWAQITRQIAIPAGLHECGW